MIYRMMETQDTIFGRDGFPDAFTPALQISLVDG
jgi:hypothetical protein